MGAHRAYTPWTTTEYETFLRMKAAGIKRRFIAEALGRSKFSITSRVTDHNRRTRSNEPTRLAPPKVPTAAIKKSDVPEFYELGWRFVGFDGALCVFEWPWAGEPQRPEVMQEVEREAA